MIHRRIKSIMFCFLFIYLQAAGYTDDQTTTRPNTLFDDADDLQKQLDSEARDKIKYGRTKTIWVFHMPTHFPGISTTGYVLRPPRNLQTSIYDVKITSGSSKNAVRYIKEWSYKDQNKWHEIFPECGGRSQSPVNLPIEGLIKIRGARKLQFCNYDELPMSLSFMNDGKRVILFGEWKSKRRPLIYGGAGHSRRYLFHSLVLHWPSEHAIGGLLYPIESQAIHISADYTTLEEALKAAPRDPQAILGVSNIYKYSNNTQRGLKEFLKTALTMTYGNGSVAIRPLSYFSPPFKEYACYQGSLTTPPCTESVLWFIRGKALPVSRRAVNALQTLLNWDGVPMQMNFRQQQPLNDRRIFIFN